MESRTCDGSTLPAAQSFTFDGHARPPVLSINRGFTAPVAIERDISRDDLMFLAAHDDDAFARHEAMQELLLGYLLGEGGNDARDAIGTAAGAILRDDSLDHEMRAELLTLPPFAYLAERSETYDPGAMVEKREGLKAWLGETFASDFVRLHDELADPSRERGISGKQARRMRSLALAYVAAADPEAAGSKDGKKWNESNRVAPVIAVENAALVESMRAITTTFPLPLSWPSFPSLQWLPSQRPRK